MGERIRPFLPDGLVAHTAGFGLAEVTSVEADKSIALNGLCQRLKVDPAQVMAFGDNLNDVDMLAWAGRGYAMANAHPTVSAKASHHTPLPSNQDGVAQVLVEEFLS